MKAWWQNVVKDYLTFTAKERNGLLILFFVFVSILVSSRYFAQTTNNIGNDAFQQDLAKLKIVIDSSNGRENYQREQNYVDYSRPKYDDKVNSTKREFFYFDPNTLDVAGWKKLGVREKTINTIRHFVAKGFKFRKPEDIKKVYGLSRKDAERLMPFIQISNKEVAASKDFADHGKAVSPTGYTTPKVEKIQIIDINTADTSAFISLPGIGNKLAARIVHFREKLGGFSSVDQLAETYGVPDSTFQKIKPRLQCISPPLKTININTADVNMLRAHPYLRWNIANAIINFRKQHGAYKSVEEIKKIDIIDDDLYNKIAPYLVR